MANKLCSIEGCENKYYANGYCRKHYDRVRKHGDPLFTEVDRHGMKKTRVYTSWRGMKSRCLNDKTRDYNNYGGRGIKVCERWMKFSNFYKDMGDCPEGFTLDRIDVNGNYEPSNCRWADKTTQSENRRVFCKNKTGCTGVFKKGNKFVSRIRSNKKEYYLNSHDNLEEAIIARLKGELRYWGYIQQKQFEYLLR